MNVTIHTRPIPLGHLRVIEIKKHAGGLYEITGKRFPHCSDRPDTHSGAEEVVGGWLEVHWAYDIDELKITLGLLPKPTFVPGLEESL